MRKKLFSMLIAIIALVLAQSAQAVTYDLGVSTSDIRLSKEKIYTGDSIRIYAKIHNYGTIDVSSYVFFYQGDRLIGDPQYVSAVAGGAEEEVWVDNWVPTQGSYNIRVKINNNLLVNNSTTGNKDEVKDQNLSNNEAITKLIDVCTDTDVDGVCDSIDTDDDNDGLLDTQEDKNNNGKVDTGETNPKKADTDGDGYIDSQDDCPLDIKGWKDYDRDGKCENVKPVQVNNTKTVNSTPASQTTNTNSVANTNQEQTVEQNPANTNTDSNADESQNLNGQNTNIIENTNQSEPEVQAEVQEHTQVQSEDQKTGLFGSIKGKIESILFTNSTLDFWRLLNIAITMVVLLFIGAIVLYSIGIKKKAEKVSDANESMETIEEDVPAETQVEDLETPKVTDIKKVKASTSSRKAKILADISEIKPEEEKIELKLEPENEVEEPEV